MKGKLQRNILIFFIAIVSVGAVTVYMIWNKPHLNVKDAPAIEITAMDLYKVFTTDSATAKSNYLNKVLAVSGVVKDVSINSKKQQIINLKTQTADASVNCTTDTPEANMNTIKAGDTIVMKGICRGIQEEIMGITGDVILERCYCSTLNK